MGSYLSHPSPSDPPELTLEEEHAEISSSDEEEERPIIQRLDALIEKVEKLEKKRGVEPLPTASGTLPVMQMSRFRKCMEEIRNHPYN